jgi:hypothetical protein
MPPAGLARLSASAGGNHRGRGIVLRQRGRQRGADLRRLSELGVRVVSRRWAGALLLLRTRRASHRLDADWNVATDALVRAVVFDGLGLDHPAVRKLLEVLAPVAGAELAYRKAADAAMYQIGTDTDDEPEFPEQDGPVFLLGSCVLVDAVWVAVGDDPLSDVLGVLLRRLFHGVPLRAAR